MEKTLRIHEFAPRWHVMNVPERFVTDSNRPQPLWQPPPTACLTASGAASEAPFLSDAPPPPHNPPPNVRAYKGEGV